MGMNHSVSMEVHTGTGHTAGTQQSHRWRPRAYGGVNATYLGVVTIPAVKRHRFARFIERGLTSARTRGMTDKDIAKATGVTASTFHRWSNGEVVPRFPTLERFCLALGLSIDEALSTLRGDVRQAVAPEPPMDPDVLILLRKLANPNVSAETKAHIKATMRYLAGLPEPNQTPRRRRRAS